MENAKKELLSILNGRVIKCAKITYGDEDYGDTKQILLKTGYTTEDYDFFLKELDFMYDDGFGCQELFGVVWLEDHEWITRREYDGSEWWEINALPDIPEELN